MPVDKHERRDSDGKAVHARSEGRKMKCKEKEKYKRRRGSMKTPVLVYDALRPMRRKWQFSQSVVLAIVHFPA